ncbi:hypothetical protein FHY55_09820 [Oceanicola sp. D3]|uniref:hypothetical protein n=1 Tax=Oceanicola sp. D3 TaxID=2587163 RepID=UPI00111F127F|nr:hypothetical protein [Oceanicola sp. D3]QDC09523.1 hypothetical protein FHY55_09820 [Oceanicola sp. D3]
MKSSGIFWPAVGELWQRRGTALRVIWLPFLISALTYEIYYRLQPDGYGFLPAILDFWVFSWAAVGWHRAALLEETPGPVGTRHRGPVTRYATGWFLAVCGAAIVALGVGVLLLWIIGLVKGFVSASPDLGLAPYEPELSFPFSLLSGPESLLALLPVAWVLIFVFFNLAKSLPAVAIEQEDQVAPQARAARRRWFASAAAWSLLLWLPVVAVFFVAFLAIDTAAWELGQEAPPRGWLSVLDFALSAVYALNVLIGASVLTLAYRRTALQPSSAGEAGAP